MNIFLTGATGFLGGEILMLLAQKQEIEKVYCLIRAKNDEDALVRIKHVFNLHGDFFDNKKIIPILGNLTDENLSSNLIKNEQLKNINVIIHAAANTSFSKMNDDIVEKVNVAGLNKILLWVKTLKDLKTFLYIGTATICGKNVTNRIIFEDESPNIHSEHFVKYSYTKLLGEIAVRENIPADKLLIVRPSIIMGDSRDWQPRSNVILWTAASFNMFRLLPVNPLANLDIISIDYVSKAIVELLFTKRNFNTYHISSGTESVTNPLKITNTLNEAFKNRPEFKFVDREFLSQMKLWSRNKLPEGSKLYEYSEYIDYWKVIFKGSGKVRILLSGLDAYFHFIELHQIFDNSRLLQDTKIGLPEPAHEYLKRSMKYLEKIDVFAGALDP